MLILSVMSMNSGLIEKHLQLVVNRCECSITGERRKNQGKKVIQSLRFVPTRASIRRAKKVRTIEY
jgi:uncharacterized OsmC-like protein